MQPLLDAPPPVARRTRRASWGPEAADALVAGHGRWHEPVGRRHDAPTERRRQDAAAERGRAVAVPADRRLRVPLQLPHRRAGRARRRRSTGCACRASTRRACSAACSTARRASSGFGPFGINAPDRARLRARDQRAGDDVEDADRLGRRARRADDGAARPRGRRSRRTRGRRPTTTPTTCSCAPSSASRAASRSSWSASRCSTTGATPAEWTLVDGDRHAADATGAGQTIRLQTDLALGIEGNRVRARHVLEAGRAGVLRAVVGRGPAPRRTTSTRPTRGSTTTMRFWRSWLGTRADPRPPLARADPALGADDQGPDLHADRRHRRRAHDLAARDAGRRAQLGLPLHLDARLDVHPAGAALAEPRLGGRRVHAVRRRPRAERGRRRCRSCTASTAAATSPSRPATTSPATPGRGRCGSATAPSTSARTTSSAPCSTRSCCTPAQPAAAAAAVADRRVPGRVRDQGLARARPGHLGGARRAAALRLVEADVLGRARPGGEARRDPRRPRAGRRSGAATAEEIRADILEHGVSDDGRAAPALRHRRARRLDAAGGDLRLPARRRRAAARDAC